jgi:hypothetical protein
MATIDYQLLYKASAAENTEITLAGESADGPVEADLVIQVTMNLADVITYSGAYQVKTLDGVLTKTYPTVVFHADKLATAAATVDAEFRSADTADKLSAPNANTSGLRGLFKGLTFSYGSSAVFTDYPVEAVVKVEHKGITATALSEILLEDSSSPGDSNPVNAFEQCLAAGKISAAVLDGTDGVGSAVFASGDEINVYVQYDLVKSRTFVLDAAKPGATGASASIKVGNVTLTAAGATETSAKVTQNVQWKFIQA